jgi:DNA repair protein RadC
MSRTIESLSDAALLGTLVGVRTATNLLKDASGSLSRLLIADVGPQGPSSSAEAKLMAARELVRRALVETMQERDVLDSPAQVREYLGIMLGKRDHEVFMALFLDAQHRVIAPEEMFRGTLTQTSVYPREVVKRALAMNAAAVIFAHNHPSGIAEPSRSDELLTQALKTALALVDVRVLDHIVIAGSNAISFAERGLL